MPSYPLTLPASPRWVEADFHLERITAISKSAFTGQQQVTAHPGNWWAFQAQLPPMKRETAALWQVFLMELRGQEGTFELVPPDGHTPRGTPAGSPLVKGGSQTGNTLLTDGWTPSAPNVLKQGDYFQVGTELKMITADVSADGAGEATLTFEPVLRASPADNAPIVTSNPKARMRMLTNLAGWKISAAQRYGFALAAMEAL